MLEFAKGSGKDSVSIFDVVYKNSEFEELVSNKTKQYENILNLVKSIKDNESGVTFLYKMYEFIQMYEKLENSNDLEIVLKNVNWKALFRYLVSKNFDDFLKEKVAVLGKDIEKMGKKMVLPLNLVLYSRRKY